MTIGFLVGFILGFVVGDATAPRSQTLDLIKEALLAKDESE